MSILIHGMKMPKNCHECVFGKYEVCAINISVEKKDTITHSCPLVEVPAHGRLIDADALLNFLSKCMFPSDMVTTTAVSMGVNWIKEAPTFIEAEEADGCSKN